jgi:plasmid maintenance system antidote protein VapI
MTPADLKAALKAIPISAGEAAPLLGVHRRTLTNWLNGHTRIGPGVRAQLDEIKKSKQRKRK